jgi:hypothetical protein
MANLLAEFEPEISVYKGVLTADLDIWAGRCELCWLFSSTADNYGMQRPGIIICNNEVKQSIFGI